MPRPHPAGDSGSTRTRPVLEEALRNRMCRTETYLASFFNRVVNIWNNLPLEVRVTSNHTCFRKHVTEFYRASYFNVEDPCSWVSFCRCSLWRPCLWFYAILNVVFDNIFISLYLFHDCKLFYFILVSCIWNVDDYFNWFCRYFLILYTLFAVRAFLKVRLSPSPHCMLHVQ
jgi:hypothetical protein